MEVLRNICRILGIGNTLQKLVFGEIKIPFLVDYRSVFQYWHPHPPCLIPLFLDNGESYKGILHHFFCHRENTFVEFSFESDYVTEIARNENQLFTLMVLNMISVNDSLSDEIMEFCGQIGYDKAKELDNYSIKYGTNLSKPSTLAYYNYQTPFIHINNLNDYDGDFPSSLTIINPKQIPDSCSFEIAEKQLLIPLENRPVC